MRDLKISATSLQTANTNEQRYEKMALAGILRYFDSFVIFSEGEWKIKRDNGVDGENRHHSRQCIRFARCILVVDDVSITFANYVTKETILFSTKISKSHIYVKINVKIKSRW